MQRPRVWGAYRVSYTYSTSMNDVGKAFFNGPIDPLDLSPPERTPFRETGAVTSLRVTRSVNIGGRARVEGLVEAFNLFNRRNDLARVGVFGSGTYPDSPAPGFGAVTAVGQPRALQFGVRVRY